MKIRTNHFLAISLLLPFMAFGQLNQDTRLNLPTADQYKKIKKQKVKLTLHSNAKIKGILFKVTEEAVILLPKDDAINSHAHFIKLVKDDQKTVNTSLILMVQTNKRNVGKGFLIGAGIGALAGAAIGANFGSEWVLVGAGLYGVGGGIVGVIIGALVQKTYRLGNKNKLEALKKQAIMYGY